ncbi:AI-2E family transporter [Weissella halotolerans]|uniref:Transport protein n=1 Tax=Weissella halotolerans DSM 20190 TaxID=1123500 RepID=A0A0R2FW74_9LACO|nr:AI-2E family transporter [Weissella halotolerans]KRN31670.1 transport protein [Weissella halotolerans DSM 20190]
MQNQNGQATWFRRWVLDNKVVAGLIVGLVILATIYMLNKVSFIFDPVVKFLGVVAGPILLATAFYYLLNPLVNWTERRLHLKRMWTILIIFTVLLGLIIWGLAVFIPWLGTQISSFASHIPAYWHKVNQVVEQYSRQDYAPQADALVKKTSAEAMTWVQSLNLSETSKGLSSVGSLLGSVVGVVVTLVTFPVILYYLLQDGARLPHYVGQFLPPRLQPSFYSTLTEINQQISNYVRGTLAVCFAVMIMFGIGYTVIGLPYGWLLAVIAGLCNIIPFIGSALALVPAFAVALSGNFMLVVQVFIVFLIEQTLESRVVSPKLMGHSLHIHPVTVLMILLSAGTVFGVLGVVLGIPVYAVLKVLCSRLYRWWRHVSSLYPDGNTKE